MSEESMSEAEKMPDIIRIRYQLEEESKNGYIGTEEALQVFIPTITQQAERIKDLENENAKHKQGILNIIKDRNDQIDIFVSEQNKQQTVIINLRNDIKRLEEENDNLREDAQEKLKDYLLMRNEKERIQEEKSKAVSLLVRYKNAIDNYPGEEHGIELFREICAFLYTQEKGKTK